MKFTGLIFSAGIAACATVVGGCDVNAQSQSRATQVRDLGGFSSIEASGGIDLRVQQGNEFRVEVTGSDLDSLVTEVRNGTLEIHRERARSGLFGWWDSNEVSVTAPSFESIKASGGSDVSSSGEIRGDSLSVIASGGSDVDIAVAVTNLEIEVSAGSDVDLSGTADTAMLHASAGRDVNGRDFRAREAHIEVSAGSDAILGVQERLFGHASGGSDVVYTGNPQTVDVETSGGSDLVGR